jgi:hypothetical protein
MLGYEACSVSPLSCPQWRGFLHFTFNFVGPESVISVYDFLTLVIRFFGPQGNCNWRFCPGTFTGTRQSSNCFFTLRTIYRPHLDLKIRIFEANATNSVASMHLWCWQQKQPCPVVCYWWEGNVAQFDAVRHVGSLSSQDLTFKALLLSMDQVTQYGKMYRDAIVEFKIRHFEDRSKVMLVSIRCMLHAWRILFDYACWQIVSILLFRLLPYIFFNTRNCVPWFYGPWRFITFDRRGMRWLENGENCITRSFVICTLRQV